MMRHVALFVAAALVVTAAGCSGKPTAKSEVNDTTEYAKATKDAVQEFAKLVKENPKMAGSQAEGLMERLQAYKSRPVGENAATYEQLVQKCKEVVDAAKRSPGSADVQKKVSELAAIANKLPG